MQQLLIPMATPEWLLLLLLLLRSILLTVQQSAIRCQSLQAV